MKVELLEIYWHGDRGRINSIDFFPNSLFLVSAGVEDEEKQYIRYWNIDISNEYGPKEERKELLLSGMEEELKTKRRGTKVDFVYGLPGVHQSPVNVVRFSPNGQYLASGGDDGVVIIWSQRQRAPDFYSSSHDTSREAEKKLAWSCNRILRGHSADIYDLQWSADSKFLVSCSMDDSAILFSVDKGKTLQRLEGHKKTVQGCAIDPLGKYIITLSADRTARVYKATKGKAQRQFYLHHILKYHNESKTSGVDEEDSGSEGEEKSKKSYLMFADESECCAFFRRTAWSPDGSFVLLPAGIYKAEPAAKPIFTVYGFTRKNLSKPAFHLPGFEKCPIGVRFLPLLYQKDSSIPASKELVDLPYKMIFAVASLDIVTIYSTQSQFPLALVRNIHYHSITDISFAKDRYLLVSSSDGYCSIVSFAEGIFGARYPIENIPPSLVHLFQLYDKIDINDISQYSKSTPTPVTTVATMKSSKNKEVQLIQELERGELPQKPASEHKPIRRIVPTLINPANKEPVFPVEGNHPMETSTLPQIKQDETEPMIQ